MSFARLPIDVWDEVLYLVDSAKDLLSLALTCQTFKKLIIPSHLRYRHIGCDLRRSDTWKALAARPRLARTVRTIKLVHGSPETRSVHSSLIFGNPLRNKIELIPLTKEHLTYFQTAFRHMTFLSQLDWEQRDYSFDGISDISDAITSAVSARYFKTLSINFRWIDNPGNEPLRAQFDKLSIWNLSALTKVVLHNAGPAAIQMLLRCSDLDALSLWAVPSTLALQLLESANWEKLQHLHLETSPSPPPPKEDISEDTILFFNRHPNLKTLSFVMPHVRKVGPLPPSSLPKLHSIGMETSTIALNYGVTDFLSADIFTRVVHWRCPIDYIDSRTLPQMDQLESLQLSMYAPMLPQYIEEFLQRAPNLKKINIDVEDWGEEEWHMREHMIFFFVENPCPNLTHIFGCLIQNDPLTPDETDEADEEDVVDMFEELSVLPRLQYVQYSNWGGTTYAKLDRDESGKYIGHHSVTLEEAGGSPEDWAGFFFHL